MSRRRYMTRDAICTKYLGPTNSRGARIKATAGGGQKTMLVSWNHALDVFDNHEAAAYTLAKKLGWTGNLIGGNTGTGYCFVFKK